MDVLLQRKIDASRARNAMFDFTLWRTTELRICRDGTARVLDRPDPRRVLDHVHRLNLAWMNAELARRIRQP